MENQNILTWIDEEVVSLKRGNRLYKIACFLLRRKLSYKELYIIISRLNEKKLGKDKSKQFAMARIIEEHNIKLTECNGKS